MNARPDNMAERCTAHHSVQAILEALPPADDRRELMPIWAATLVLTRLAFVDEPDVPDMREIAEGTLCAWERRELAIHVGALQDATRSWARLFNTIMLPSTDERMAAACRLEALQVAAAVTDGIVAMHAEAVRAVEDPEILDRSGSKGKLAELMGFHRELRVQCPLPARSRAADELLFQSNLNESRFPGTPRGDLPSAGAVRSQQKRLSNIARLARQLVQEISTVDHPSIDMLEWEDMGFDELVDNLGHLGWRAEKIHDRLPELPVQSRPRGARVKVDAHELTRAAASAFEDLTAGQISRSRGSRFVRFLQSLFAAVDPKVNASAPDCARLEVEHRAEHDASWGGKIPLQTTA